jgi:hypothetical protein
VTTFRRGTKDHGQGEQPEEEAAARAALLADASSAIDARDEPTIRMLPFQNTGRVA